MDSHNTIVDLATVPVPLPSGAHGMFAAFSRARLVHAADRLRVGVLGGHDLLASIS